MYLRAILLLTIMLTFLVAPDLAMAQANMFEPVGGDKSIELLSKMFGKLGVFNSGAPSEDSFASVIQAFNGAVLTIGGVLVSYTILIGTIGTAHDGEMLGKKFSSAWVPIRTAAGTALVLPVIGGSYCVMQAIVGWLIVQGVGLADLVWGQYMSSSNIAKTVTLSSFSNSKDKEAAWNIFSSAACMHGYSKVISSLRETPSVNIINSSLAFGVSTSADAQDPQLAGSAKTYYYGAKTPANGFTTDFCGSRSENFLDPMKTVPNVTKIDLINPEKLKAARDAAINGQTNAYNQLIEDLDKAAISYADKPDHKKAAADVNTALEKYSKAKRSAATGLVSLLSNFEELEKSSTKDGWILAGAWYMRMSYLMDVINKLTSNSPTASGVKVGKQNPLFEDKFLELYGEQNKLLSNISGVASGVQSAAVSQSEKVDNGWFNSSIDVESWLRKKLLSVGNFTINDGDHPVMSLKSVGNNLLGVGTILGPGFWTASLLLPEKMVVAMQPFVMTMFPIVIGVGFTLSFVLPMMPFMIWIGVVLGWVILCVEAIIAAPLWAVMHLSPHGDDMVGTGAQGYRLVLSLMLRPVLMIFGLIAALTIIAVFGGFIQQIFTSVFLLSQQDSGIVMMLLSFIALPFIYMGLMWTLIVKTMSIIHVIPDQLLQWFGGGGPQIGDYGQTLGGMGSQSFAATAAAAGLAGKALDMSKASKDLRLQAESAKSGKESVEGDKMSRAMGSVDQKIGAGASNLQSQIMQRNGQNPSTSSGFSSPNHDSIKQMSEVEQTSNALGGQLGEDYRSNLSQMLADPNNATEKFSTLSDKAAFNAISSSMGSSAASFIMGSSNKAEASNLMQSIMKSPTVSSAPPGSLPGGVGQIDLMNKIVGGAKTKEDLVGNMASMGMVAPEIVGPPAPTGLNPTMSGAGFTDNPGGGEKPPSE